MGAQRFGPFSGSDNPARADLGFAGNFEWQEVTVSVFDENGDPATGTVTGTLAATVLKNGADRREAFDQTLNLASGQRAWDPELSRVVNFEFTVTGLNANYSYEVTVNSWGGV